MRRFSNAQLIKLKRSKEPIFEGDVFVCSPAEGVYFFGKVLQSNIQHVNERSWYNGCHVVFIFNFKTHTKGMQILSLDYNQALVGPEIVNSDYWSKGWFETVGNIPLTEEEKSLDYGFFDMEILKRWGSFYKANGEEIDHIPKFLSGYGINTYTGIYQRMRTEAIINPDLFNL